jgi:hypothetical protein
VTDDYIEEDLSFVVPEDRYHDGWDGAAGCEYTDETVYMPYPHPWDSTLTYCQVRFAMERRSFEHIFDRSVDRLPGWVIRRALPYFPRKYTHDAFYDGRLKSRT